MSESLESRFRAYVAELLQQVSVEDRVKALVGYLATKDLGELLPFESQSKRLLHREGLNKFFASRDFSAEEASKALRLLLEGAIHEWVERSRAEGEAAAVARHAAERESLNRAEGGRTTIMDPITIMNTISIGLKLIDQFRELTMRFLGKRPQPPSQTVEQAGDTIQRRQNGQVVEEISAEQMHLNEWDDARYHALERRVRYNWNYYNELYAQEIALSADERARIRMRMETTRGELCADFREMCEIIERTLGISLPDHYKLYEVCGN